MEADPAGPDAALAGVIASAQRLGVELDEAEASECVEYFERRLFEVPSIKAYIDGLVAAGA